MSLEGRDLSDTQILDATQMEHDAEKDAHRLAIKLPSGRTLYSDYGPAEELRKRLIPWCESVRSAIDGDVLAEREEKIALADREALAVRAPASAPESSPPIVEGAEEYAAKQLAFYQAAETGLVEQYGRIARSLEETRKEVQRWRKVAEALKEDEP